MPEKDSLQNIPSQSGVKQKAALVVCPDCEGWGVIKGQGAGTSCPKCLGRGVWVEEAGINYFWTPELGTVYKARETTGHVADIIIKILMVLFIIFAYLEAFVFFIDNEGDILALVSQRGIIPLVFWLATLMVVFLIYRMKVKPKAQWGTSLQSSRPDLAKSENSSVKNLNIAIFLSLKSKEKIRLACEMAKADKSPALIWYLLKVLVADPAILSTLIRLEQKCDKISDGVSQRIKEEIRSQGSGSGELSPDFKEAIFFAYKYALSSGKREIDDKSLLTAVALNFRDVGFFFEEFGVDVKDLPDAMWWIERRKPVDSLIAKLFRGKGKKRVVVKHKIMNRAWTARPTPTLDHFSYDITDYVMAGLVQPIVDRESEIHQVMRVLERNNKNNALLVGESGSGRRSIVREIGRLMVRDEALPKLRDKRLVVLDAPLIVSGVKAGGELEQRVQTILHEIQLAGNIILFIPDIHSLAESGAEHGFDISEILTPVFTQSYFQVIGTTTFYDYHRVIEKRADFADAFEIIKVDEVSPDVALEIVVREAPEIEAKEEVSITFNAIKKSVELSRRYVFNKLLPAKAIDLLSEAAVMVRTQRGKDAIVGTDDIMHLITEKTGIPVNDIGANEAKKLINLEEEIHKRMVDQKEAVKAVAEAIKRMRVGLKNEKRPMGVFLFLGPTGVGKTELAKTLAEVYFGNEKTMVRLDMSEFQEPRSIDRLIGNPEAQIDGILTEGVKRQPFSLVLLDEFEKSHPNVLDLFLQVFDDGRLTDGAGRTVDFTNTIIIATSNAGAKIIQERIKEGKTIDQFKPEIEDYLLKYFKPELLNRFNGQIVFKTLSQDDILAIAKLQIAKLAKRLENAQGIKLEISQKALEKIAALGFSPLYGARNLQRTITDKIENTIANKFLKGEIKRGKVFTIEDIE